MAYGARGAVAPRVLLPRVLLLRRPGEKYLTTFKELGLNEALLQALRERGFETPTPIQAEMIPYLLEHTGDVAGLAQTGTGKTAAFGLPVLQEIDCSLKQTQALILAPARELCTQVAREITDYGRYVKGLHTVAVYGGAAFGPQIRSLRMGAHIVVATPGRLKDLLEKGVADLSAVRFLVLDEADQMLDMGFKEDLDAILDSSSAERRTLLFSATMPPDVARIAAKYMRAPHEIVAGERNRGVSTVEHKFFRVHAGDKYAALRRLIDFEPGMYGLVFCRTRDAVRTVSERLGKDGYSADALHGELSQNQREAVLSRFRQGNLNLLVATDVAARGLDVDNLTHVIHYDLPDEAAVYNHRSGRTGRAGKTGKSLALVHLREGRRIQRIEKVLGREILPGRIPGGAAICERQLESLAVELSALSEPDEENPGAQLLLPPVWLEIFQKHLGFLTADELIERLVARELGPLLREYSHAEDLNPAPPPKRSRRDAAQSAGKGAGPGAGNRRGGGKSGRSTKMVKLRVNVGRRHSVFPPQLIGLVNQASRSRDILLGRIDIHADWSEFQVEAAAAGRLEEALRGFSFQGVKIRAEQVYPSGRNHLDSRSARPPRRKTGPPFKASGHVARSKKIRKKKHR